MTKFQRTICWLMIVANLFTIIVVLRYNNQYKGINSQLSSQSVVVSLVETYNERYDVVYESKEQLIERLAIENDFDVNIAKNIAHCESHYGKYNFNKYSSAKGIYQFIDKTWKNYCSGDVLNDYDNINCFIKLYNKHRSWWKCSYDNL